MHKNKINSLPDLGNVQIQISSSLVSIVSKSSASFCHIKIPLNTLVAILMGCSMSVGLFSAIFFRALIDKIMKREVCKNDLKANWFNLTVYRPVFTRSDLINNKRYLRGLMLKCVDRCIKRILIETEVKGLLFGAFFKNYIYNFM